MTTTGFLLAVLGTNIFWAVYFVISMVVMVMMCRKWMPKTYKWIITGKIPIEYINTFASEQSIHFCKFESVVGLMLIALFWPFIIASYVTYHVVKIAGLLFGKLFKLMFVSIDKMTPNVDIKIVKKD